MPELDRNETDAVVGLLVKTVRLIEQREQDQKLVEELTARVASNFTKITQAREALGVFGFEEKPGANIWDDVREALGVELYNASIALGKRPPQRLQIQHITEQQSEIKETPSEEENSVGTSTVETKITPKISDAIVEYLMMRGEQGAKVGDVKNFLSLMYDIDTHEKTPGMTLYRLSQQNPPLARREGRTWFFVPPPAVESKNPGAGTPGSEEGSSE